MTDKPDPVHDDAERKAAKARLAEWLDKSLPTPADDAATVTGDITDPNQQEDE